MLKCILIALFTLISASILLIFCIFLSVTAQKETPEPQPMTSVRMMDRFNLLVTDALNDADSAARSVNKVFWLQDDAQQGPVPNPDCYGTSDDPSSLSWLLEQAGEILDGQDTYFSTDVVLKPGSQVTYYLDETIFAVTWKQIMDNYVYTISEVKIAHPSQFRRYIADGEYNSRRLYPTSFMSQKVNAVVGSSADYYLGRKFGTKVYDGIVRSVHSPEFCDICYIDRNGDLIFSYQGELLDEESIQKFVTDHNISFSISFGPILVDDGVRCEPYHYALGEVNDPYPRAALCQRGPLHYLVVVANSDSQYFGTPTIHDFAKNIATLGCEKAYSLDGGNTGSIVMNGKLINCPPFGYEREISDIIYFCTALPNHS